MQIAIDELEVPPRHTCCLVEFETLDKTPGLLGTTHYPMKQVNFWVIPIGRIAEYLELNPESLQAVRMLVIQAMRQNQSGMYRRWHSETLVREAIKNATT